ncbi:PTS transporter subunit EIIC [uncultured Trichococcus sp.]|uniref:PTS sugar transporter subunit IIC n=1 Tax=uncultured Trichococcus sp. TaxID=189665 RepID=UPI002A186ECA|nr:PTS transporter subunit EIIC [uncultured Trichococcus sp.]
MEELKLDEKRTTMDKFMDKLTDTLLPIANALNNQKHISALKKGMLVTVPLTIVGAIFLVLAQPPVDETTMQATNIFFSFMLGWKSWAVTYQSILLIPYQLTIGILSVYTAFVISYFLANEYGLNGINNGMQGLLTFLTVALVPTAVEGVTMLPMTYLDAKGMFTAIIVGLVTVEITRVLDKYGIKIKMPDSVPPMVSAPFEIMIPIFVNILLFLGINQASIALTGSGLVTLVQTVLAPFLSASGSLGSIMFINFLMTTFWFLGIHGASVVSAVVAPITTANFAENAAAYQAGEAIPHIFAGSYNSFYGGWITYPALLFCFLFLAKSAQLKSLTRAAVVPNLFNINEPLIFGLPIVMNVIVIIPTYICTAINIAISYIMMSNDIVGKVVINIPWTTPGPIAVFLSTLDWKATVLWFVLFAIDFVICIPFVKSYDKQVRQQNSEI